MSYIVSASKNIRVNADQNIIIKELIAHKDRVENQQPYFQLAYEQLESPAKRRLNSQDSHDEDPSMIFG